jgi:hypothetical protein
VVPRLLLYYPPGSPEPGYGVIFDAPPEAASGWMQIIREHMTRDCCAALDIPASLTQDMKRTIGRIVRFCMMR